MPLNKMKLTGKQLRLFRSQGHKLSPVASIGKAGLSIAQVENIRRLLETHELIKIRLPEAGRKQIAQELAAATGSQCVEVIGRTSLLYRPKPT